MTIGLDDILQGFASDGWAGLERLDERLKADIERQSSAEKEERQRQAALAAAALGSGDGAEFLQLLIKMTVLRPATAEERTAPTAERYAILKAQREGQNNLIFTILAMLAEARGEERQPGGEL